MRTASIPCLFALAATAACGDLSGYPSLRPRAFEAAGPAGAPVPPPPPAPPARAAVVAQADALAARATAGQRAFARELPATRTALARAGEPDSESWIAAQQALSVLDASRVDTVTAMAELDALNVSGVDAGGLRFGDNDFAAIRRVAERVYALAREQQRTLGELGSVLRAPV